MHNNFHVLIMNGGGAVFLGVLIGFGVAAGVAAFFAIAPAFKAIERIALWLGAGTIQWIAGVAMKLGKRA